MPPPARSPRLAWLRRHGGPLLVFAALAGTHVALSWLAMGGRANLLSEWPLLQADHALHAGVTPTLGTILRETGFAAGYDPNFMAGSAVSAVSSTFLLVSGMIALLPGVDPAVVAKLTIWAALCSLPALMAWAGFLFGLSPRGVAWAILLYLAYFWADFPIFYIGLGMVAFVLAIPAALVALALLAAYLERGGAARWAGAALSCSATFFLHPTTPLVFGVAGLLAYGFAWARAGRGGPPFPWSRHLAFWGLAPVILAANGSWFLPTWWLRGTVGQTAFAFVHPEPVLGRLAAIFLGESAVQPMLIGLGLLGLAYLGPARPVAAVGLGGMIVAGFAWGYLAGALRALDPLQPGRQTYACYAGLCLAAGVGLDRPLARLRDASPRRADRWATLAILLVGGWLLGPGIRTRVAEAVFAPVTYLSSRPLPAAIRLVADLKQHVRPGERLLFEETGVAIPGLSDPYSDRHVSAVLPRMTGVEVLGGPYLHMPVRANFTQFGEGKLFGVANWGRDHFVRYARLYRPTAIACWTPHARTFCRQNPDLIQVLDDNPVFLMGRVVGFEGAAIRGRATVAAGPNRLVVRDMTPDGDGLVVLRYHLEPNLVAEPALPLEPIFLEADPVPFIGIRPGGPGPVAIRMALPPRSGAPPRPEPGG